jgi:hypothetical protein
MQIVLPEEKVTASFPIIFLIPLKHAVQTHPLAPSLEDPDIHQDLLERGEKMVNN